MITFGQARETRRESSPPSRPGSVRRLRHGGRPFSVTFAFAAPTLLLALLVVLTLRFLGFCFFVPKPANCFIILRICVNWSSRFFTSPGCMPAPCAMLATRVVDQVRSARSAGVIERMMPSMRAI